MEEVEVEKVVQVVLIFVTSLVASYIIVNQFEQVILFIATIVLAFLSYSFIKSAIESSKPEIVKLPPTYSIALAVVCLVVSAVLVYSFPNVVKVVCMLGLTCAFSYLLIKYFAPDVAEEIREVLGLREVGVRRRIRVV